MNLVLAENLKIQLLFLPNKGLTGKNQRVRIYWSMI